MGVGDNKSYKDQYHFKDVFSVHNADLPSLDVERDINSSIKENPYKSNVEIEGGEIVLNPDLMGLFKAHGKKHSQGGMDVVLKNGSFVFSDDKTLALSKEDHDLFELKKGGSFRRDKNTPAEVLKRNIDVKHYNTLIDIINDTKADELSKKSSIRMLEKYIEKLGQLGYIQEGKKGFPDGVPSFSEGAAPVFDASLKSDIMESKQYAKYGGNIKYQRGSYVDNPFDWMKGKPKAPAPKNTSLAPSWSKPLYTKNPSDITDAQAAEYEQAGQEMWDKIMSTIVNTDRADPNQDMHKIPYGSRSNSSKVSGVPRVSGVPEMNTPSGREIKSTTPIGKVDMTSTPNITAPPPKGQDLEDQQLQGKRVDWEFTPWQKISQGYNWLNYANVKRYMPYRSNYKAMYADPSLVNPEQAIGDMKSMTNQQISSLNTLNPILRNAQASSAYGQYLSQVPGVRSQYDNQNAQIRNQFNLYNNQEKNRETMTNLGFDQQYYQQAIEGRKNFDNMRTYMANNAMNNVMRDVETNQKLAYNLLTVNNPAYGYDWKSGNFYRNPKNILDVQGRDGEDTFAAMMNQVKEMKAAGLDPQIISALVRGQFFKQAAPYFSGATNPPPYPYKKGGKYRGK